MERPAVGTRLKTRTGSQFSVTPRTFALDVSILDMEPPASWLLVNGNNPVVLNLDGEAWSTSPTYAVSLISRVSQRRADAGQPVLAIPMLLLRAARHLSPAPVLPWPAEESEGYNHRDETLNVHRPSGNAVLVRQERPTKLTPLQAAAWRPTYVVQRVGVRAALDWLKAAGFRMVPASLTRRGKLEQLDGGEHDAPPGKR
jgi:hypothetical protein